MFNQYKAAKRAAVLLFACGTVTVLAGGCGESRTDQWRGQSTGMAKRSAEMIVEGRPSIPRVRVLEERPNGRVWIPLEDAVRPLGLRLHELNGRTAIGDTDSLYSVRADSNQALSNGGEYVELPEAPRQYGSKLYMTRQSLAKLLGTKVDWDGERSAIQLASIHDGANVREIPMHGRGPGGPGPGYTALGGIVDIDQQAVVNYARTYIGTKYEFGAADYTNSRTFDCSSFMQHVFERFGIHLPRSSRAQSELGTRVGINSLQPADLMFFYTPNRYASNEVVGHVGMYIGNGRFIQTYGAPGVMISELNAYWKGRFLFGKRVAK